MDDTQIAIEQIQSMITERQNQISALTICMNLLKGAYAIKLPELEKQIADLQAQLPPPTP